MVTLCLLQTDWLKGCGMYWGSVATNQRPIWPAHVGRIVELAVVLVLGVMIRNKRTIIAFLLHNLSTP